MKAQLQLSMTEPADVVLAVTLDALMGVFAAAVLATVWVQVQVARSICRKDNRPFSWLWMISLPGQWRTMRHFYAEATMLGIWRIWLGAIAVAFLALGILAGLVFTFGEIVE